MLEHGPVGNSTDCLQERRAKSAADPIYSGGLEVDATRARVTLPHWTGRTGNNVGAVLMALFVAHLYNSTWAEFPAPPTPPEKVAILFVPSRVRIDGGSPALSGLPTLSGPQAIFRGVIARGALRSLAEHYVRPMLNAATKAACDRVAADVSDAKTLVVHLRSGDVLEDLSSRTGHFAPCALANKIMAERGFERAVLITEPDLRHPCIGLIRNVSRIQSSSVPEDACAIMHAKNLATMSRSTFPDRLGVLNPNLQEYHLPGPPRFGGCAPAGTGTPVAAKLFYYAVHGWSGFRTVGEKMNYIAHANGSSVELLAKCSEASESFLRN